MLWDAVQPDDFGPYSVNDCLVDLEPSYGELYDTVEDARTAGVDDADFNVSLLNISYRLRNKAGYIYDLP